MNGFTPVSTAELANPPSRDWLHWRGNPGSWGYSPLKQINTENVGRLQIAWVWGMHPGTNQHAPLVRDGIMYLSNRSTSFRHWTQGMARSFGSTVVNSPTEEAMSVGLGLVANSERSQFGRI